MQPSPVKGSELLWQLPVPFWPLGEGWEARDEILLEREKVKKKCNTTPES